MTSMVTLPLENAWIREPLRIWAAISRRPSEIIEAFIDEYDEEKRDIRDVDSGQLNKLADLLVNASEVVAYLPRPVETQPDDALRSLVLELGKRAQELYEVASQKGRTLHDREREVGWLSLQDKCLGILRNIYACEFLAAGRDPFSERREVNGESMRSNWKRIHNSVQQEPDAFQHIAYLHLYPIKRARKRFPIARHSLFFYVMESVLCFRSAYGRLVKETHPRRVSRFLIWLLAILEKFLSLLLVLAIIAVIADPLNSAVAIGIRAIKGCVVIGVGWIFAWCAQIAGYMPWKEFPHFPFWVILRHSKRAWSFLKKLCPVIIRSPAVVFRSAGKIGETITRYAQQRLPRPGDILTKLVRSAAFLGSGVLLIYISWVFVVPAVLRGWSRLETEWNGKRFVERAAKFEEYYSPQREEILAVGAPPGKVTDFELIAHWLEVISKRKEEVQGWLRDGQNLEELSKVYETKQHREIVSFTAKFRQWSRELIETGDNLLQRREIIQFSLQAKNFIDDAEVLLSRINKHFSNRPNTSVFEEIQQYLENTRELGQIIERVLRQWSDLQRSRYYRGSNQKNQIESIVSQINQRKTLLGKTAARLEQTLERLSPLSPAVQEPGQPVPPPRKALKPVEHLGPQPKPPELAKVVEPEQEKRTSLLRQAEKSLAEAVLKESADKFLSVEHVLSATQTRLRKIAERGKSPLCEWCVAVIAIRSIKTDLKYLEQVMAANGELSSISSQLIQHEAEVRSVFAKISDLKEQGMGKRLQNRLAEIESLKERIQKYQSLIGQFDMASLQTELANLLAEANQKASAQFKMVFYLVPVAIIGLILLRLWRRYGDKAGGSQLEGIKTDFDSVLTFVVETRYSLRVYETACEYLRKVAPLNGEALRKISEAAEQRLRNPGELNARVGLLLRDVAQGIENILNRQLPS